MEIQRAFAQGLRRPEFSVKPQLDKSDDFLTYGGEARADIPLSKNTTLGLTAGGMAGRGFGEAKGAKMPFTPRGGVTLKHEF